MNAINLDGDSLFPSKKATEPFSTNPAHGTHGWCKTGSGQYTMFIFMKKDGLIAGWYTPENFASALQAKRDSNRCFYKDRPGLLTQKIRGRKENNEGYRMLRIASDYH